MPERTEQPPEQPSPTPCTACKGRGGTIIDTSSHNVTRKTWATCTVCHGTGTAEGRR